MANFLEGENFQQPLPAIKTFKNDVADAVKRDNVSAVKIALAEQARADSYDAALRDNSIRGRKGIIFFILSLVCIVVGGGISWYVLHRSQIGEEGLPQQTHEVASVEQVERMDVSSKSEGDIIQLVHKQKEEFDAQNKFEISRIIPQADGKDQTLSQFLYSLGIYPQNEFVRVMNDQFFFGLVKNQVGKASVYFILEGENYEREYAAMLGFEPSIGNTLIQFYNIEPYSVYFSDLVIKNRDVRALVTNEAKEPKLLYTFLDSKTIVIAEDEKSLETITNAFLLAKRIQ